MVQYLLEMRGHTGTRTSSQFHLIIGKEAFLVLLLPSGTLLISRRKERLYTKYIQQETMENPTKFLTMSVDLYQPKIQEQETFQEPG